MSPVGRPAHRPSRRSQVIAAAVRSFGRNGVAGTTVADIAEECGVAPASIYYHFRTKEALLAAAVQAIGDDIDVVTQQVADEGVAPADRLARVVADVFAWSSTHPDEARLFFLWAAGSGADIAAIRGRFVSGHVQRALAYQPGPARGGLSRSGETATGRALAATTAIELAMAVQVAWLAGEVFPAGAGAQEVASALTEVMARILDAG